MSITIEKNLANRAERMKAEALNEVHSAADWEQTRPERKREFLKCLGLEELPKIGNIPVRECGAFVGDGYRARKLAFEMLPDCWGSAIIYYPDPASAGRAPALLYVCGHAKIGTWHYQYSPILWARRGYVCLIVDTIDQHDNLGEHHGFSVEEHDRWLAMGYTSAGGETWNSLCALEILLSDNLVDPDRVGVTGLSGGGAVGFYVAALDERIKALSSLCGISTPVDAIVNQRLSVHCDCIYPHNVFGRDLSEYAALLAPRAALFCFGEHDSLYCPEETTDFVRRTRKVYEAMGVGERCQEVTYACGHENHPVFNEATQKWFDHFVAGEERTILQIGKREISERTTSIFNGHPPEPNHLRLLPELLSRRGGVLLPDTTGDWERIRQEALRSLPSRFMEEPTEMQCSNIWKQDGIIRSLHKGTIGGVDVSMEVIRRAEARQVVLSMAGGGELLRHPMARIIGKNSACSIASFAPRLSGANYPGLQPPSFPRGTRRGVRQHLMRAMALTGQTPVMMYWFDLQTAFEHLLSLEMFAGCEWYLHGRGESGVASLYLGLFDDRVAGVIAEDFPTSHTDGAPILGSLRAFDIPEAVGLMAPRKIAIVNAGHGNWTWPLRAYERLGCSEHFIQTTDLHPALAKVLNAKGSP